jgi:hypothetical protein
MNTIIAQNIYVVEMLVIEDCNEIKNEIVLFAEKQNAKDFARNFIEGEKEILNNKIESGSWIEDDDFETQDVWECYENGYYTQNRSRVSISEKTIWECCKNGYLNRSQV